MAHRLIEPLIDMINLYMIIFIFVHIQYYSLYIIYIYIYIYQVGGLEHVLFFHILGIILAID